MTVAIAPREIFENRPEDEKHKKEVEVEWQKAVEEGQSTAFYNYFTDSEPSELEQDAPFIAGMVHVVCHHGWTAAAQEIRARFQSKVPNVEFRTVSKIEVGETVYPFRSPIDMAYDADSGILLVFPLRLLETRICGASYQDALDEFARQFHLAFQELEAFIPSEMNRQQRDHWGVLSSWLDIQAYREQTPIVFRRVGTVITRDPFVVKWLDHDATEELSLADAVSRLAALQVGNWFKATVKFDRQRQQLTSVLAVEAIQPVLDDSSDATAPQMGLSDLPDESWDSF